MSPRAIATIRRSTNQWMIDEIEVWDKPSSEHDDNTLVESHTSSQLLWESKARITPTRGPREQPVGEGVMVMREADILIPHDSPAPIRDQQVRVKSSADPSLVGRWFSITDVRASSQQAARRFSVVQHQRSEDWNP
jgi:hypothetical protein